MINKKKIDLLRFKGGDDVGIWKLECLKLGYTSILTQLAFPPPNLWTTQYPGIQNYLLDGKNLRQLCKGYFMNTCFLNMTNGTTRSLQKWLSDGCYQTILLITKMFDNGNKKKALVLSQSYYIGVLSYELILCNGQLISDIIKRYYKEKAFVLNYGSKKVTIACADGITIYITHLSLLVTEIVCGKKWSLIAGQLTLGKTNIFVRTADKYVEQQWVYGQQRYYVNHSGKDCNVCKGFGFDKWENEKWGKNLNKLKGMFERLREFDPTKIYQMWLSKLYQDVSKIKVRVLKSYMVMRMQ